MNQSDNKDDTDGAARSPANQRALIRFLMVAALFATLGTAVGLAVAPTSSILGSAQPGAIQEGVAAFEAGAFQQALAIIKPAAEKGNAQAAYWLGQMYENGLGLEKDSSTALSWYHKAAEGGWTDAKLKLGELYFTGTEELQDFKKARKWLEQAARDGNSRAQLDLGQLYANGWGGNKDRIQAYVWYEFAAKQGNYEAERLRDELIKVMPENEIAEAQDLAEKLAAQPPNQGKDETKAEKVQQAASEK